MVRSTFITHQLSAVEARPTFLPSHLRNFTFSYLPTFLCHYQLSADEVPLLTMQPDYERAFFVGSKWGSHGDPTQTPQHSPVVMG